MGELLTALQDSTTMPATRVGRFERLPKWLNLIPMVLQWCWLGLRHRSLTLPSAVNRRITAGGLVGEGKQEYFASMGPVATAATAAFIVVKVDAGTGTDEVCASLQQAGLGFPVVAKPDIGWCGFGVRRLDDTAALALYLREFPRGETLLLQRYLAEPGEAGLFYVREPGHARGRIHGILLRRFPAVTGNGVDAVATLVANDARVARGIGDRKHDCAYRPDYIPGVGETVRLATIASTRVGGLYEDGTGELTPMLEAVLDGIAHDMDGFEFGRFDVRYANAAALARGEFVIMEVNGAGSEAVHAWDPRYSILDVYRIVFAKQRLLFRLGAINRRAGHRAISERGLVSLYLRQQRLMRLYPRSN
jgi:hypothetical protein